MRFLDISVLFKLDRGQITVNPVENAFASQQLAFLATSIAFYHIVTRACVEIKHVFRLFDFWIFFWLSFFLLLFLFAAMQDFLLGLLAVKKLLRKRHRDGQILAWSSQARSFSKTTFVKKSPQ